MATPILIIFIIGLLIEFLAIVALIICKASNNKAYCYLFEHKSWKLWETVCKALPDARFMSHYTFEDRPELNSYHFHVWVDEICLPVEIIYWETQGDISVHNAEGCLLSSFDKYHVKKAWQILKPMLLNR